MNRCRDRQEILAVRHVTAQHGGQVQCTYCLPPTQIAQESTRNLTYGGDATWVLQWETDTISWGVCISHLPGILYLCLSLHPHRYSLRQRLALPGGSGEAYAGVRGIFPFGKRIGGRTRLSASGLVRSRKTFTGDIELSSVSGWGTGTHRRRTQGTVLRLIRIPRIAGMV